MRLKIRDLRVGDGVDLLTFPPDYPFDDMTRHVAETQMAEVQGEVDGANPFDLEEIEADDCWVLHTDNGSFGVDPDWEVEVERL